MNTDQNENLTMLLCLSRQVYAWGDNDHGQQGNGTTTVNRKPTLVQGLEGQKITRVACGSSHSVAWTTVDVTTPSVHEPVLFQTARDSLGASYLGNYPCPCQSWWSVYNAEASLVYQSLSNTPTACLADCRLSTRGSCSVIFKPGPVFVKLMKMKFGFKWKMNVKMRSGICFGIIVQNTMGHDEVIK